MNELAKTGARYKPTTVGCKYCNTPTRLVSIRMCDSCYELEWRLHGMRVDVLAKILRDALHENGCIELTAALAVPKQSGTVVVPVPHA